MTALISATSLSSGSGGRPIRLTTALNRCDDLNSIARTGHRHGVVCLTLAKWETVSGPFGGYLTLLTGNRDAIKSRELRGYGWRPDIRPLCEHHLHHTRNCLPCRTCGSLFPRAARQIGCSVIALISSVF